MKNQMIKDRVNVLFIKENERSVAVKKNIVVSQVLKCISILTLRNIYKFIIEISRIGIW